MSFTTLNVTLSEGQRAKLRTAFRQRNNVTILLSQEQLRRSGGRDTIAVTSKQANDIGNARSMGKGYRLHLSFNQLKANHQGGFLPLVFAGLAALRSLIGGASAVANSVIDYKDRQKKLEEVIRHNKVMENKSGGRVKQTPLSKTPKNRTVKEGGRVIKKKVSSAKQYRR